MSRLKTISVASCLTVLLLAVAGWLLVRRGAVAPAPSPASLKMGIYVWQQKWSPAVSAAVLRARGKLDHYFVYAARIEISGDLAHAMPNRPDWKALAGAGRPVTLVMRAPEALTRFLARGHLSAVAAAFLESYAQLAAEATQAGCRVEGLQLDYDCPTALLKDYRALLENLRPRLGSAELSITVLPTWIENKAFGPLVQAVPWYTLQVHGIERPTTIDKPIILCDERRIGPWLRRAADYSVPFYVALPTYAYRVVFDRGGRFAGLVAEGSESALRPGFQERRAEANPTEMAAVMRELRRSPPRGCRGVIWFRLPIETDRLNWPWPALAAVMDGRVPRLAIKAEVRHPDAGLYEVWIGNTGEIETGHLLVIPLNLNGQNIIASDVVKEFTLDDEGLLRGPAPPLGPPRLVAWFRVNPRDDSEPIKAGNVECRP